ncbi:hypothetical protein [Ruficoccus sp. ZRK36]|uniref:ApeP family dehydratase n=1 Tax=Ruficoccus sp. ZRK36 TaxID=2866311 RepID=UPI001C736950|nr:hypothetical protein [Ruficoccus sp. ZRK36]QYY36221.1 hypothetical protein K0V07_01860 [Ruficoccus sp. ZRK36]
MSDAFPPIEELIPHRGPMCLLRRIVEMGDDLVQAEAVFVPDSGAPATMVASQAWSLEVVAQAAGVFVGWHHRERGWRSGRLIKATRWTMGPRPLPCGEMMRVYSKLDTWSEAGVFRFNGHLEDAAGNLLAGGQLTIYAS